MVGLASVTTKGFFAMNRLGVFSIIFLYGLGNLLAQDVFGVSSDTTSLPVLGVSLASPDTTEAEPFEKTWTFTLGFGASLTGAASSWENLLRGSALTQERSNYFFGSLISTTQYPLKSMAVEFELRGDFQYHPRRAWGGRLQSFNSGLLEGYSNSKGHLDVEFNQQSIGLFHRWAFTEEGPPSVYVGPSLHRVHYQYRSYQNRFNTLEIPAVEYEEWKPGVTGGLTFFPFIESRAFIWRLNFEYAFVPTLTAAPHYTPEGNTDEFRIFRGGDVRLSTLSVRVLVGFKVGKKK